MSRRPTRTLAVSAFKATCLAVLEDVRRTGASVLVTKRGVPIAEIVPPSAAATGTDWIGAMAGTVEFVGDVVGPVADPDEWEALGS